MYDFIRTTYGGQKGSTRIMVSGSMKRRLSVGRLGREPTACHRGPQKRRDERDLGHKGWPIKLKLYSLDGQKNIRRRLFFFLMNIR